MSERLNVRSTSGIVALCSVSRPSGAPGRTAPPFCYYPGVHVWDDRTERMGQFHRPPRFRRAVEALEVALPSPPIAPRNQHLAPLWRVLLMTLLPALLPPIALAGATLWLGQSSTIIVTSVALASSLALAVGITTLFSRRDDAARERAEQAEYQGQLARHAERLRAIAEDGRNRLQREREVLGEWYPPATELMRRGMESAPQLWERRPGDADFLALRLGLGTRSSSLRLRAEGSGAADAITDALVTELSRLESAPVSFDLAAGSEYGLVGSAAVVAAAMPGLLLQMGVLHSPHEVKLAVFSRDLELCDAVKWLPHCRLDVGKESHVLVGRVGTEASPALRSIGQESALAASDDGIAFVVFADANDWESLPGRMERWLPTARDRMAIVHIRPSARELPPSCQASILLDGSGGRVIRRNEAGEPPTFQLEPVPVAQLREVALTLARIEVADSQARVPIPREARLTELLRLQNTSVDSVLDTWNQARRAFRLAAPIAAGPNGSTVDIDLRRDGPHGLIAGTTGSGKSELLQSLVVGLAARIPPDLLNFVLFDYKGGSAFREVAELPHVTGVVTDLNERLAARALASLRAELQRRERLIADSAPAATNIIEYQSVARATPLANLVIIIDEFHRLVTEQPEFVEQMVQIAQQGRSLGVHLLLSTQKPSGVVSDHIRANTNLRICLRVTDESDSRDVLGGADAAFIPREVPGRMYIRVGNERLKACQAGRVSGVVERPSATSRTLDSRLFLPGDGLRVARAGRLAARIIPSNNGREDDDSTADVDLVDERKELIEAIRAASTKQRLPLQPPPWQEALPPTLELPQSVADGARVVVGRLDEPELLSQRELEINLEAGHICIVGGANSGKTTALLTIATALARKWGPDEVHIYGIDFAGGGLGPLDQLPHSGGVAAQHEPARVEWVLSALRDVVGARLAAGSFASPRIVVLIDNFPSLWSMLQNADTGQGVTGDLAEVMDLGRSVGVTFAITMERADALRGNFLAMMGTRLALPVLDSDALSGFGLGKVTAAEWIPGRALILGRVVHEAQLAMPSFGGADEPAWPTRDGGPLRISPLPASVDYGALIAAGAKPMLLGLREGLQQEFRVEPGEHLTVLGTRKSGRSNALAVAMHEARRAGEATFLVANPRRAELVRSAFGDVKDDASFYAERDTELGELWQRLETVIEERFRVYAAGEEEMLRPLVIVIDDAETLDFPGMTADILQRIVLRGSDIRNSIFLAAETQALRASYPTGVIRSLLTLRSGLLLSPATMEDFELLGVRGRPVKAGPGRGYWCEGGGKHAVQVGLAKSRADARAAGQ